MATSGSLAKSDSQERGDLVAYWSVPLTDGVHTVEFEHGTTSGKRVIRIDGKEILRRDWMFKLVGDEYFTIGQQQTKCELKVDPMPHFSFGYSLYVDGKPLQKFTEKQAQTLRSWAVVTHGKRYRVVFEKHTLNVWVNGKLVEVESSFVDDGTEMKFELEDGVEAAIRAFSDGDKKKGILQQLYIQKRLIEEDTWM